MERRERPIRRERGARFIAARPLWGGVAVAVCLLLAAGCGDGSETQRSHPGVQAVRHPDQRILGFVLTETEEGRKLWVLEAEEARVFDSSNEIDLDTLVVDFFDEDGAHVSQLTSKHGVIQRTTRDMRAFDDVEIVTDEGLRLESDEVRWASRSGKIVSDTRVRFTRGRNVLTGVGFESDPSLENIEIFEDVQADVLDPEDLRTGDGGKEGAR